MKRFISVFVVFILIFTLSNAKELKDTKIAVIDYQKAVLNSDEGKKAKKEMEEKISYYKKQIEKLQKEFEDINKQLQSPVLSEEGKKKKKEELRKIEEKMRNLQMQAAQELNSMRTQIEKKLLDKVKKAVEKYAKKHGIDIVLVNSQLSGIIYANPSIDITDEIIKELNRK